MSISVKKSHNKTNNIAILHCVSAYPTKEEDANLSAVYTLKENCQKCNFKTSNAHYKFIKIRDVLKSISKN